MEENNNKSKVWIVVAVIVVLVLLCGGCCLCCGGFFGFEWIMDNRPTQVDYQSESETPDQRNTEPEPYTEPTEESTSLIGMETEPVSETETESESETETQTGDDGEADALYEELALQYFVDSISDDPITLHFRLKDPSKYGIEEMPTSLGHFSVEDFDEALAEEMEVLEKLEGINREALSEENKISYDVLKYALEQDKDFKTVMPYLEPLSGVGGVHVNLGTTMASYRLDTKQDVEDYLSIMDSVDEYLDDTISFEDYKMEQGTFMSSEQAKTVAKDCRDVIAPAAEDSTFCTSFEERLESISGLTEQEKKAYIERNTSIVKDQIYPAYEELAEYMDRMSGEASDGTLLADSKGGKAYYEYLVRTGVGTDKTVAQLKTIVGNRINRDTSEIYNYYTPEVQADMNTFSYTLNDPKEIIEDLKIKMQKDFPDGSAFAYEIKEIPEDMRSTSAPAYYIVAPIDATDEDVDSIFYNPSESDGGELYHTLAHEGFPGHLFQTNYFRSHCDDPLRHLLRSDGYVEGYATYVEMQSYLWGDGPIEGSRQILRLNASATLGIYAYLDIMINYYGWDRIDTADFVGSVFGESAVSSTDALYNLIIEEPANYLNYYVGYLEIEELRDEYLAKGHSLKEFHTALLDIGPAPFPVIREHLIEE